MKKIPAILLTLSLVVATLTVPAGAVFMHENEAVQIELGTMVEKVMSGEQFNHYYKISVNKPGSLEVTFSCGGGGKNFSFYNSSGDSLCEVGQSTNINRTFKVTIGNYYLRIGGSGSGGITYKLVTKFTPTTLTIKTKSVTLGVGEEFLLKPKTNSANPVNFTTNPTGFATVNYQTTGNLIGKKPGKTVVTAEVEGLTVKVNVTVKKAPKTITTKDIRVEEGDVGQLTWEVPSDTNCNTVTYRTSDKKIATVNKKGEVTGKKPGTCYVTITTFNGKKAKAKVTVY